MKYIISFFSLCIFLFSCSYTNGPTLKTGDIVFQSTPSSQSQAIKLATDSRFCHTGMVVETNGKLMVFEAVEPVRIIPLDRWIRQGDNGYYEVKRLKPDLAKKISGKEKKLDSLINQWEGRRYDPYFNWSDETLYCSELVWKTYSLIYDLELCKKKKLKEYNFSHPAVRAKLKERYGDNIPWEEEMVSPEDIYRSALLENLKK